MSLPLSLRLGLQPSGRAECRTERGRAAPRVAFVADERMIEEHARACTLLGRLHEAMVDKVDELIGVLAARERGRGLLEHRLQDAPVPVAPCVRKVALRALNQRQSERPHVARIRVLFASDALG